MDHKPSSICPACKSTRTISLVPDVDGVSLNLRKEDSGRGWFRRMSCVGLSIRSEATACIDCGFVGWKMSQSELAKTVAKHATDEVLGRLGIDKITVPFSIFKI